MSASPPTKYQRWATTPDPSNPKKMKLLNGYFRRLAAESQAAIDASFNFDQGNTTPGPS